MMSIHQKVDMESQVYQQLNKDLRKMTPITSLNLMNLSRKFFLTMLWHHKSETVGMQLTLQEDVLMAILIKN